ncbi:MAG: 50S ribosomal protein L15e [Theionarchaea archaeon]|nr:MAG: 50S ribosomal protein L15e [Theionarchaea archaeon DG-70]MBU7009417.1 50S ribosomal protein L15e [Theionarchaea archaeon]
MGYYKYVREAWKSPDKTYVKELMRERLPKWRNQNVITRIERPTRPDRARTLGYKAKPGFVMVRARIRRGGRRKERPSAHRKPKSMGVRKITMRKNLQWMAEERVARKYPNMEVINSYWVAQDGKHKYFEVILVDPHHPAIQNDPELQWVQNQKKRGLRGKTSAAKKSHGLRKKGKGAEKLRPKKKR